MYNKKHIPVEEETRDAFKEAAKKAGMTYDGYLKYLLNLGRAYPPTIDYKKQS